MSCNPFQLLLTNGEPCRNIVFGNKIVSVSEKVFNCPERNLKLLGIDNFLGQEIKNPLDRIKKPIG